MAKKKRRGTHSLGGPAPLFSWPWAMSHETWVSHGTWAMKHEPVIIDYLIPHFELSMFLWSVSVHFRGGLRRVVFSGMYFSKMNYTSANPTKPKNIRCATLCSDCKFFMVSDGLRMSWMDLGSIVQILDGACTRVNEKKGFLDGER